MRIEINIAAKAPDDDQDVPAFGEGVFVDYDRYQKQYRLAFGFESHDDVARLISTLVDAGWVVRTVGIWTDPEMLWDDSCIGATF